MRILLELFWEMFKISLFVVGGGYAILPVADEVFARRGWTTEGELVDHLPVFQMLPGIIAAHTAVYVGNKVAGLAGAVVCLLGVVLPSVVIFTLIAMGFAALPLGNAHLEGVFGGLRASLTGVIGSTIVRSWPRALPNVRAYLVMLGAVTALLLGVPIPLVLVVAMLVGLACVFRAPTSAGGGLKLRSSALVPLLLFAKYGLLCFGGGFVIVPMYLEDFVGPAAPYLQLPSADFSNVMALTQMTPGPIGANCATFFGYRLAGVGGALTATALLLLPGAVLALLAFRSLDRFSSSRVVRGILLGVKPVSIALMLVALGEFARAAFTGPVPVVLTFVSAGLIYFRKLSVVKVILLSALVGLAASFCGI